MGFAEPKQKLVDLADAPYKTALHKSHSSAQISDRTEIHPACTLTLNMAPARPYLFTITLITTFPVKAERPFVLAKCGTVDWIICGRLERRSLAASLPPAAPWDTKDSSNWLDIRRAGRPLEACYAVRRVVGGGLTMAPSPSIKMAVKGGPIAGPAPSLFIIVTSFSSLLLARSACI